MTIKSFLICTSCQTRYFKLLKRFLNTSHSHNNLWDIDTKGGYEKVEKISLLSAIKQGSKLLPEEFKKLKKETTNYLQIDQHFGQEHGDYEVLWKFDNQKTIDDWIVSADSDHNEGFSKADLILGPNKTGIFSGKLDVNVPKDGKIAKAGYCQMHSPKNMISFYRERPYEFECYTHFIIRLRGDGRIYNLNCQMKRYFDLQWHDLYSYMLFTRGGPYWQIAKIPFSKFFLTHKGRIMDKQEAMQTNYISHVGITLGDAHPGPFQLEIDYIAVVNDSSHTSTFEYEMYEVAPGVI